jgi:DNA-directed RNA polymerase specialized sigma24 family protein
MILHRGKRGYANVCQQTRFDAKGSNVRCVLPSGGRREISQGTHPIPEGGDSMPDEDEGSVTAWIGDLKSGGDGAAQALWERYFEQLVNLARKRLRGASHPVADAEDAALGAFDSFCRGVQQGRFPRLDDRNDLWRILVVLTRRRVADQIRREMTRRRGGGTVQGEAVLEEDGGSLDQLPGLEPTPEFAAMVAEEYQERLDSLTNDTLRRIAVWKLEGYTADEVALRLGCSRRSVQRKLDLIRREWCGDLS